MSTQQHANTSLWKEHSLSLLDSNGLNQAQGQQTWVGVIGTGFVVVSRKRSRDWQRGRSQLGGTDRASLFCQSTGSLFSVCSSRCWHAPVPQLSCPVACVPTSLPSISTWGYTVILHAQLPLCSLLPDPLPGRIICYLFCSLRHIFILTQYNWRRPVGQY